MGMYESQVKRPQPYNPLAQAQPDLAAEVPILPAKTLQLHSSKNQALDRGLTLGRIKHKHE